MVLVLWYVPVPLGMTSGTGMFRLWSWCLRQGTIPSPFQVCPRRTQLHFLFNQWDAKEQIWIQPANDVRQVVSGSIPEFQWCSSDARHSPCQPRVHEQSGWSSSSSHRRAASRHGTETAPDHRHLQPLVIPRRSFLLTNERRFSMSRPMSDDPWLSSFINDETAIHRAR